MRKLGEITLGILTSIGGFIDIGELVATSEVGARYGMELAWVTPVAVLGIILYAEMAGRVATLTGRATFDLVRERLGPRLALANLLASSFVNFLTLAAEIAGVALALELVTSVNYLLFIPVCALLVWVVIWRVRFRTMERVFSLLGLVLVAFGVAVWRFGPDWGALFSDALHPSVPDGEGTPTYFFYAIALFGAGMTPYEAFFFSSGAVEEHWDRSDLMVNRVNVYLGFTIGGVLSLAIMTSAALVLEPAGVTVSHLSQVALPVAVVLGKLGLAAVLLGFFAATFGAALETGLSAGYAVAQYFGWQWGKFVRPAEAARFHLTVLIAIVLGTGLVLTTVDPITVTEYSLIFSAVALPLTYFPILVVANDPGYMGDKVNSGVTNFLGSVYLVITVVAAVAALPIMVATKAGGVSGDVTVAAGRVIDAAASLLDSQILDADGRMAGKVDDAELEVPPDGGPPRVTALLVGSMALSRRLGGRLGWWIEAVSRRLHPEADPGPTRVPVSVVKALTEPHVDLSVGRLEAGVHPVEDWVRLHVVARIPGSRHAPE